MRGRRAFLKEALVTSIAITQGAEQASAGLGKPAASLPSVELTGDWQVRVQPGTLKTGRSTIRVSHPVTLEVARPALIHVTDEKHEKLPLYDPKAAPWGRGAKLRQLTTYETTATDMLVRDSLALKEGPGSARHFAAGKDFAIEEHWATIGRLPEGIGQDQPVWVDYDCGWNRIDTVTLGRKGAVSIRQGMPHNATPHPPALTNGETALANLWIPGRLQALTQNNIYPILEATYPRPIRKEAAPASTLLPKTWAKLHDGSPLHVLAWGDSVTAGGQVSDAAHLYQSRFVALLHAQFPGANIRLTTAAWGGRNTDSFLNEPPGAEFNFAHAVLEPRPDLIVMEFVNDAWMTPDVVETKYSYLQKRFGEIGAEWIILTPHFVRPDWMGATSVRVEADPRPYVAGVRQFTAKHHIALADTSLRWGHLVKEGIPYTTLLSNSINHPDDRGHEMFAQALIDLFR